MRINDYRIMKRRVYILIFSVVSVLFATIIVLSTIYINECRNNANITSVPLISITVDMSEYMEKGIVRHTVTNNSGVRLGIQEPSWSVFKDGEWQPCYEEYLENKMLWTIDTGETINGLDGAPDEGFKPGRYMVAYTFTVPVDFYFENIGSRNLYCATAIFDIPERGS